MKKALALLLAVAATMSVGVTALANDVNIEEIVSSSDVSVSESASSEDGSIENSAPESSETEIPEDGEEAVKPAPTALQFKADVDNDGAVLGTTILEPGTEYKFPVEVKIGDNFVALADEHLKDYKFTYSRVSSNGVKTFKIDEYKGNYYLYVTVSQSTPLKPVDVKYNVKMVEKANNMTVFSQEVKFSYGYDEANGDYLNGLDKGDAIEIDNSRPVITGSQFDKIAKLNDYKNVTLSGPSWNFTVNVTDETTKNMVSSNAGIKEILSKLPDQEFKFFTFAGKPTFSATGKVALDVSDIADDYEKLYTYRYADGKLYRLNATFNEDDQALEFRTNKLDNFVVTDKLIKDGFVVSESNGDSSDKDESGSGSDSDKNNPSTGASDMVAGAVAAAIASLAAAGTIAVKKSSK